MNHQDTAHTTDSSTLRNQVLSILLEEPGEFVSGADLSERLKVSRTAVWKHIRALEEAGCNMESVHRLGYRLQSEPDVVLQPVLQKYIETDRKLGKFVQWVPVVDSTNTLASKLAKEGAPHGTLVTALVQDGGRGRRGRPWFSPKEGQWMSLILKQPFPLSRAAELTLLASVAIRRAIQKQTGLKIDIKWPNDLLCNGRKISGILAEIRADGETVHSAVVGIGINVNIPAHAFPSELKDIATSLFAESGQTIRKVPLVADILCEFEPMYNSLVNGTAGFVDVSEEWRQACSTLGTKIRLQTGANLLTGVAESIDNRGVLYLRTDDGTVHQIHSGDVLF